MCVQGPIRHQGLTPNPRIDRVGDDEESIEGEDEIHKHDIHLRTSDKRGPFIPILSPRRKTVLCHLKKRTGFCVGPQGLFGGCRTI